jgi:hypothetical protein
MTGINVFPFKLRVAASPNLRKQREFADRNSVMAENAIASLNDYRYESLLAKKQSAMHRFLSCSRLVCVPARCIVLYL